MENKHEEITIKITGRKKKKGKYTKKTEEKKQEENRIKNRRK